MVKTPRKTRGGFEEAPQPELTGTPLAGSISDWAEQIEHEAEKEGRSSTAPLWGGRAAGAGGGEQA
ncbi:MAG: hypothetical protein WBA88_20075, partial [Pseudaminobacter sp.]